MPLSAACRRGVATCRENASRGSLLTHGSTPERAVCPSRRPCAACRPAAACTHASTWLTRYRRVEQSLERTLCEPCPYCQGEGRVKSTDTICLEILRECVRQARPDRPQRRRHAVGVAHGSLRVGHFASRHEGQADRVIALDAHGRHRFTVPELHVKHDGIAGCIFDLNAPWRGLAGTGVDNRL